MGEEPLGGGGLCLSPNGRRMLDDGWVWHPIGIVSFYSISNWLQNSSEMEESNQSVCCRSYFWNSSMCFIDNSTVAVYGLGDDDVDIIHGARIFNLDKIIEKVPLEVKSFAGPAGEFFSNSTNLFSAGDEGLDRWDIETGALTGRIEGFKPVLYHKTSGQLVERKASKLIFWEIN